MTSDKEIVGFEFEFLGRVSHSGGGGGMGGGGGGGWGQRKAWRSPHPVFERDNVVFPIETFKILCKKSDTVPYKILLN